MKTTISRHRAICHLSTVCLLTAAFALPALASVAPVPLDSEPVPAAAVGALESDQASEREWVCAEHPQTCTLLDQALATANAIPSGYSARFRPWMYIGRAQARAGLLEAARGTFARAIGAANAITIADNPTLGTQMRIRALAEVARALAEGGLTEEARRTFADAVDQANALSTGEDRAGALLGIARAQVTAGLWDGALSTADLIAPGSASPTAIGTTASAQREQQTGPTTGRQSDRVVSGTAHRCAAVCIGQAFRTGVCRRAVATLRASKVGVSEPHAFAQVVVGRQEHHAALFERLLDGREGAHAAVDLSGLETGNGIQRDDRLVGELLPCPAEQAAGGPDLSRGDHGDEFRQAGAPITRKRVFNAP